MRDAVLGTELLEPVCTAVSRGDNYGLGLDGDGLSATLNYHTAADLIVSDNEVAALKVEGYINAIFKKVLLDGVVYLLCLLCSEVANGTVDKLQTRLDGVSAYLLLLLLVAETLNVGISTKLEVDAVGVLYKIAGEVDPDEARQVAANLLGKRELAV